MIFGLFVVFLLIALAVYYWYVAVPLAALIVVVLLLVRRHDRLRLEALTPERRVAELARRAESKRRKANTYKGVTVLDGRVSTSEGDWPLAGASARVETAGEITSRLSASRLVVFGPLGLFARKRQDKRELYLTIEGVGFSVVKELNPDLDGAKARKFAAQLNGLAAAEPAQALPASGLTDMLRELGQLRDAGVITPAEFDAKKAELLGRF